VRALVDVADDFLEVIGAVRHTRVWPDFGCGGGVFLA